MAALGVSAEVVPVAARYLFIRAFAAPAWKGTAICSVRFAAVFARPLTLQRDKSDSSTSHATAC